MLPGFLLPGSDRAFVQPEGSDNRRGRTAKGQQGQDDAHDPKRRFQLIQRRANGVGEGRAAGVTLEAPFGVRMDTDPIDRKSTRLNSSHANISYAVFCLKK